MSREAVALNRGALSRAAFLRSLRLHASCFLLRIVTPVWTFPFVASALRSSRARCPRPVPPIMTDVLYWEELCLSGPRNAGHEPDHGKKRYQTKPPFRPGAVKNAVCVQKTNPNEPTAIGHVTAPPPSRPPEPRNHRGRLRRHPKSWRTRGDLDPDENRKARIRGLGRGAEPCSMK